MLHQNGRRDREERPREHAAIRRHAADRLRRFLPAPAGDAEECRCAFLLPDPAVGLRWVREGHGSVGDSTPPGIGPDFRHLAERAARGQVLPEYDRVRRSTMRLRLFGKEKA